MSGCRLSLIAKNKTSVSGSLGFQTWQQTKRWIQTGDKGGKKSGQGGHGHHEQEFLPQDPHQGTGLADPTVRPDVSSTKSKIPKTVEDFANPDHDKNWISYGFDHLDKDWDRFTAHFAYLLCVSGVIWGTSIVFYYYPDFKFLDWSMREAFLEMNRRKKLGLKTESGYTLYVTKDLVDPSTITLPSEEELEGFEIII